MFLNLQTKMLQGIILPYTLTPLSLVPLVHYVSGSTTVQRVRTYKEELPPASPEHSHHAVPLCWTVLLLVFYTELVACHKGTHTTECSVGEYSQYTCLKGQPLVWERD